MDRSRTKQVCTIGPASAELIAEMVAAGMDVARVNFSHGTADDHRAYVHAVRAAAHAAHRSVAVMADLPGPKLRLGELLGGEARLETGGSFMLRASEAPADASGAHVPNSSLASQLHPGDRVLLADGAVELRVTEIAGADVQSEVVNGGLIRSRAGVKVPSERLTGEGLTDDDRAAVARALELRVDLIAQSLVCRAADVRELRALLPAEGPRVVAKIETRAAIDDFDAICSVADGIMIARGDLGVDVPFEDVPLIQKDLVRRATAADRFTIVATQMLESMTAAPRPTRAEASDVANAVLDGADAVMLSAETAIGAFPLEALQAMERICGRAEADRAQRPVATDQAAGQPASREIITAASYLASRHSVDGIWCFTRSGRTAEMLSLQRPGVPIVAFTLSPIVARRLAVRSAIVPLVLPAGNRQPNQVSLLDRMEAASRAQRGGAHFDTVLLVTTSSQAGGINRLELHAATGRANATPPVRTAARRAEDRQPSPVAQPLPPQNPKATIHEQPLPETPTEAQAESAADASEGLTIGESVEAQEAAVAESGEAPLAESTLEFEARETTAQLDPAPDPEAKPEDDPESKASRENDHPFYN